MYELTSQKPFGVVVHALNGSSDIDTLSENDVTEWLDRYKLVVLRGFNALTEAEMMRFAQRFGPLLKWEFGEVLNLRIDKNPQNHLFRSGRVEMHWDGAYLTEVPRYSLFQCLQSSSEGVGGETIFTDTIGLIDRLPADLLAIWTKAFVRYETDKAAHYCGSVTVPLIGRHPRTGQPTVRFIEPYNEDNADINPVHVHVAGLAEEQQEPFLRSVIDQIYAPEVMYRHQWHTGDLLIYDNNALLHGRAALQGNVNRRLQRIHILDPNGQPDSRSPVFIGAREMDVHI
jgi:alpha-ketoglutarate-dependent taurine dioxygenase